MINAVKKAGAVIGVLVLISGTVWGASEYLQSYARRTEVAEVAKEIKNEIVIAGTQAKFVIDQQIESLVIQIDHLRRKPNRTRGEEEQLRYLERQLDVARKIREGK